MPVHRRELLTPRNPIVTLESRKPSRIEADNLEFGLREKIMDGKKKKSLVVGYLGILLNRLIRPIDPSHFIGDQSRIQQILMNLANNAIKCTARGKIELSLKIDEAPAGCRDSDLNSKVWVLAQLQSQMGSQH